MGTVVAVRFFACPAEFAIEAGVVGGFDACAFAEFPVFHVGAELHDGACAFVARGAHVESGHGGEGQVVEHVVDVGIADAGGIEFDEDIVWAWGIVRKLVKGLDLGWIGGPGSGTGTSSTVRWKFGPSLFTTPALHVFGTSKVFESAISGT